MFCDTDDPTTIYGRFWILQRTFASQELVKFDVRFLSFILNKTLASKGFVQAGPNQWSNNFWIGNNYG